MQHVVTYYIGDPQYIVLQLFGVASDILMSRWSLQCYPFLESWEPAITVFARNSA